MHIVYGTHPHPAQNRPPAILTSSDVFQSLCVFTVYNLESSKNTEYQFFKIIFFIFLEIISTFFRRKQSPTTFAKASQHLPLYNGYIFLNSSSTIDQNFINHFLFYFWGLYVVLCSQHILVFFSFSFSIINSLSIFHWLSFFISSTHRVGGFPGGACSICS